MRAVQCKEDCSTVSRSGLTLAISGMLFLGAVPGFAQITVATMPVTEHPAPGQTFKLAEAYPGTSGTYAVGIAPNRCWSGSTQTEENIRAVPGVFCLVRDSTTFRLLVEAFATCGANERPDSKVVQSYRLKKEIPGSRKCPEVYRPATFWQFGSSQVRTWWTLIYTQPGTKFVLEVTVRCLTLGGQPKIHIDRWTWEVVANLDTFENVIHVLHQGTLGTLEIPCIVGEDMFEALTQGLDNLRLAAVIADPGARQVAQQDALFSLEALVVAYAAVSDFVDPDIWFPAGPPGNLAPMTPFQSVTGLTDTLENPCACKLLVDLEYLGTALGIVSL
jgi:hypothetical protein